MSSNTGPAKRWSLSAGCRRLAVVAFVASLALAGMGCSTAPATTPRSAPAVPAATTVPAAVPATGAPSSAPVATAAAVPAATPVPVLPLKVEPVKGYVGDTFTISGEKLPPGKTVEFLWATVDGAFVTEVYTETIVYQDRKFTEKRVPLGRTTTDDQGRLTAKFAAPEDYGETHDIYAMVDGQPVARGGFRILPQFSVNPLKGPVGTPITIKATGIGVKVWENMWEIGYDNKYTGFISAVTTRGTATAVIRAAGPVGKRVIDIWHGGQAVPYLNWEQSPQAHIPIFSYVFNVTGDPGAPALALEAPVPAPVTNPDPKVLRTTSSGLKDLPGKATMTPASGSILSTSTLRVTGLPANLPVDIFWITARGSRTSGLGWALTEVELGQATTREDGSLVKDIKIPDDLGGWHTIKVIGQNKVLAEAPYLVNPSLIDVSPRQVKVGETFTVKLKGIGWTELDNIYSVTYDNAWIGFACGFNSNGDVTINFRATGAPGTHLIDLYPTIYQYTGHAKPPMIYDTPMLTFARDHPSLEHDYRLPAFRLAITVVE